jgi:hypothetical protein
MTARSERRATELEEATEHLATIRLRHAHTLDRADREAIRIVLAALALAQLEIAALHRLEHEESPETLGSRELVVALQKRAAGR